MQLTHPRAGMPSLPYLRWLTELLFSLYFAYLAVVDLSITENPIVLVRFGGQLFEGYRFMAGLFHIEVPQPHPGTDPVIH